MYILSILFPVHNEAQGIVAFISDVVQKLKGKGISYEIICIENGSTDNSYEKLILLSKKYKNFQVIQSAVGWGNAVRAGIQNAKGVYTCYMVSDGQIDPIYIYKLFILAKNFHEYQLIKVWRTTRENRLRLVNSRSYNSIAQMLLGIKSWDINATPKIMETKLLKSIPFTATNIGWDAELLWHLKKRELKWIEIPVQSVLRETGSSTTKLSSIWEMLRCVLSLLTTGKAESKR